MELQLINGHYRPQAAVDLVTQLVNVKIKRHEDNIGRSATEEDIAMAELRIQQLQTELADFRKRILAEAGDVRLESTIQFSAPVLAH